MPTAVLAVSSQLLWILRCQKNILEPFYEVQKGTKVTLLCTFFVTQI